METLKNTGDVDGRTKCSCVGELHEILQNAFSWSGEHLHRFLIHGAAYGIPCLGGIVFREDARRVPLSRFRLHCGERFRYEYDESAKKSGVKPPCALAPALVVAA